MEGLQNDCQGFQSSKRLFSQFHRIVAAEIGLCVCPFHYASQTLYQFFAVQISARTDRISADEMREFMPINPQKMWYYWALKLTKENI